MRCGKSPSQRELLAGHGSQPARMRCGKFSAVAVPRHKGKSQPARMRCGKFAVKQACEVRTSRNPRECAVANSNVRKSFAKTFVATRANALWQISPRASVHFAHKGRNPRECAVANNRTSCLDWDVPKVATRANALWQIAQARINNSFLKSQPARMRCGKNAFAGVPLSPCAGRNPRECAVAKW